MKTEVVICRCIRGGILSKLVCIPKALFVVLHILLSKMLQQVQTNCFRANHTTDITLHRVSNCSYKSLNILHSENVRNIRFKPQ